VCIGNVDNVGFQVLIRGSIDLRLLYIEVYSVQVHMLLVKAGAVEFAEKLPWGPRLGSEAGTSGRMRGTEPSAEDAARRLLRRVA
jgi:hypothetical protein